MSVILKQFDGGAIAPRDDAILYNSIITRNGILNGCTITHLGANQIKITAGRGIIKGRMFEVEEMTVNCQLASAGTQKGRMYLRMELSNMENPAQIKTVAANTLPELVQEEDCNYTNGIYELELCTYDVTDTLLSNLETTYEVIDTVFPVAKTLDDVNGVTDGNVLAGALAVKELSSDINGCQFFTEGSGADTKYYIQSGADTASKKELGNPMLVKIGTFTAPAFGTNEHYDIELGTTDYDTIIIIATWADQSDYQKAGIAISSAINDRSAYGSAYGTGATSRNQCTHGKNPYFQLLNDGETLRLLQGNTAWSNFPAYYMLLKLNPVIVEST